MVKAYYRLTKPGIIYGNTLTASAGFLFAGYKGFSFSAFFGVIIGTALVIGGACVFNNVIDRRIDAKMERTKRRALVTGLIPVSIALIYALVLTTVGFIALGLFTNALVVLIGIIGFVDYLAIYGFFKRRSTIGTLVGSVCGATPVIAGYCAATGEFNTAALLLFLIMVFWQMPHFYSIAIYRGKEYTAADIPVLPMVHGIKTAVWHISLWTVLFILANVILFTSGYAGVIYLIVMLAVGIWWLRWAFIGFSAKDKGKWARKMFGYSLIVLLTFSLMLSVNYWLP